MPSVDYLTIEDILLIHRRIIEETGGSFGVRSMHLLESAINRPKAGFGDQEFYPDLFSKAAALFESIILNHPFVDGNKRTATVAAEFFIENNGWRLEAPDQEIEDFAVHVAPRPSRRPRRSRRGCGAIRVRRRSNTLQAAESMGGSGDDARHVVGVEPP